MYAASPFSVLALHTSTDKPSKAGLGQMVKHALNMRCKHHVAYHVTATRRLWKNGNELR